MYRSDWAKEELINNSVIDFEDYKRRSNGKNRDRDLKKKRREKSDSRQHFDEKGGKQSRLNKIA